MSAGVFNIANAFKTDWDKVEALWTQVRVYIFWPRNRRLHPYVYGVSLPFMALLDCPCV